MRTKFKIQAPLTVSLASFQGALLVWMHVKKTSSKSDVIMTKQDLFQSFY